MKRNRKKLAVNPLKLNTADGVDVDGSDNRIVVVVIVVVVVKNKRKQHK